MNCDMLEPECIPRPRLFMSPIPISDILSFDQTDLHFNHHGSLSERQRQQLEDYIDVQGGVFMWNLLIVGSHVFSVSALALTFFNGDVTDLGPDLFVMLVMIAIVIGVIVIPYSLQQVWRSFVILQHYRENRVEHVHGVCQVRYIPQDKTLTCIRFGDVEPRFILDADEIKVQSGLSYDVYYLGDVLLAFERA